MRDEREVHHSREPIVCRHDEVLTKIVLGKRKKNNIPLVHPIFDCHRIEQIVLPTGLTCYYFSIE